MAGEVHPVPSRTRKLSPPAPMVLRSQSVGEQDVADQRGAFLCRRRPGGRAGPPGDIFLASLSPARRRLFVRRPSPLCPGPGPGEVDLGLGRGRRPGTAPPLGRLVLWGRGPGSPRRRPPVAAPPSSVRPPLGPPRGGAGVVDVPVPTSRDKPTAAPLALNLISAPQISSRALLLFGYLHYRSPTEFEHF